jgi:hypothetical protein
MRDAGRAGDVSPPVSDTSSLVQFPVLDAVRLVRFHAQPLLPLRLVDLVVAFAPLSLSTWRRLQIVLERRRKLLPGCLVGRL